MKKFREMIDYIEEVDNMDELLDEEESDGVGNLEEIPIAADGRNGSAENDTGETENPDPYTKLPHVLAELIAGIVLCGIVLEIPGIWFVKDPLGYSVGLLIGIVMAVLMAVHMAWSLDKALDLVREDAEKKIRMNSMTRYFTIVIILGVMMYFRIGNPLAAFLGLMSLKVAAYLQPFTHKYMQKIYKNEDL
ncbi:MAG: ATP synthase subunit I [Lachnospiraceae bacterium]|nr:ATP synthase subunit I [Lachnospiraceae bacterium]